MQENITNGQMVKQGLWEFWDGRSWQAIKTFSTVGYKRLLRFNPIQSSKVRVTILEAKGNDQIQLSEIGIYKASQWE
jgi:alpha-L-fucosidase